MTHGRLNLVFGKLREGFQNCMAYLHPAVIVYCIVMRL